MRGRIPALDNRELLAHQLVDHREDVLAVLATVVLHVHHTEGDGGVQGGAQGVGTGADLGPEEDDIGVDVVGTQAVDAAGGDLQGDAVLIGILFHLVDQHARGHTGIAHQ